MRSHACALAYIDFSDKAPFEMLHRLDLATRNDLPRRDGDLADLRQCAPGHRGDDECGTCIEGCRQHARRPAILQGHRLGEASYQPRPSHAILKHPANPRSTHNSMRAILIPYN